MHEIGNGLTSRDARERSEDDGHVEFDAGEDVGADDGSRDVGGVDLEDEEDAGEGDDGDADGQIRI